MSKRDKPLRLPKPDMKARLKDKPKVTREFLNADPEYSAFVIAEGSQLKLSDCNRIVNIDFGLWDHRTAAELDGIYAERMLKLQKIVNACATMADNLVVGYNQHWLRIHKEKQET